MDASAQKRARGDALPNGNGSISHDLDSGDSSRLRNALDKQFGEVATSTGNRTKACTKFFSTSGCPYGEGCHFLHYVPGGINSLGLTPLVNIGSSSSVAGGVRSVLGGGAPVEQGTNLGGFKTRLCNKYETAEGCRFGEKCHFAHGDKELRKANGSTMSFMDVSKDNVTGRSASLGSYIIEGRLARDGAGRTYREPTPPGMAAAASFGASSTAKISIDASLAGAIIGKGGVNAKQICHLTGAKLSIRDHETDPKKKNVEMEGSFEQIKQASQLVQKLLMHKDTLPVKTAGFGSHNYKTKMCENYSQGTCIFGDRCHFAHGATELREAADTYRKYES